MRGPNQAMNYSADSILLRVRINRKSVYCQIKLPFTAVERV
jgi:hypothetical protein